MNNFLLKSKVYFGKGGVKEYLGCLLKHYDATVMLAYGGGSVSDCCKVVSATGQVRTCGIWRTSNAPIEEMTALMGGDGRMR